MATTYSAIGRVSVSLVEHNTPSLHHTVVIALVYMVWKGLAH